MKFKTLIRRALSLSLGPLVRYTLRQVPSPTVIDVLWQRALDDTADYILARLPAAVHFSNREALWDFALGKITLDGLYAEFGVFQGASINYFARRLPEGKAIYGFD